MPVPVGERVTPYEMLARLGEGGMGDVWKARDTRLDRLVAVKRLDSASRSEAGIIRRLTGHRSRELERYEHLSPGLNQQTVELIGA